MNTITSPMKKIPLVEPITDWSSAGGVGGGVACIEMEAAPQFRADVAAGWLQAEKASKNARISKRK